jgi:hypothetical protein
MEKRFCDICDKPAVKRTTRHIVLQDKVLCDKSAKIQGIFNLSFKGHSTGFGGPPDLCEGCYSALFGKYMDAVSEI